MADPVSPHSGAAVARDIHNMAAEARICPERRRCLLGSGGMVT